MVMDAEQEEAAILGRAEAEKIARIGLLLDEGVRAIGTDRGRNTRRGRCSSSSQT